MAGAFIGTGSVRCDEPQLASLTLFAAAKRLFNKRVFIKNFLIRVSVQNFRRKLNMAESAMIALLSTKDLSIFSRISCSFFAH